MAKEPRRLLLALGLFLLAACASNPNQQADQFASELGLSKQVLFADGVDLVAFANAEFLREVQTRTVRVYLGGDGRPWTNSITKSSNPTSKKPLIFELMAIDHRPAIYLARPCYHLNQPLKAENCSKDAWTKARYSVETVRLLNRSLQALVPAGATIDLVGFSGGGTLATLLAQQNMAVHSVTTMAANLDTEHWANNHGYTPLDQSLNPANMTLRETVSYTHYFGANDQQMDHGHLQHHFAKHPSTRIEVLEGFDHRCCWLDHWRSLLSLESAAP